MTQMRNPDYWTRLEHQYAGMAMQQLVTLVNVGYEYVYEETAIIAINFAHALVEELKAKGGKEMKIEIEIDDDLAGYQFKSDENNVIHFEDMSRREQIHVLNAFAGGYELFINALKEE